MSGFVLFKGTSSKLRSYHLTQAYFIWSIPFGFYYYFRAPLGDVQPYPVQWVLLSLISEDNHSTIVRVCSLSHWLTLSEVSLIVGVVLLYFHPHSALFFTTCSFCMATCFLSMVHVNFLAMHQLQAFCLMFRSSQTQYKLLSKHQSQTWSLLL